jgi:protein O-mannosyl-transferase
MNFFFDRHFALCHALLPMGHKPDTSGPRSETLIAALLVVATLAVYARACSYGFINYDDGDYVYNNRDVLQGLSFQGVLWALTTTEMVNWHPLTWLSFQADATLFAERAWGYHLTNSLFHAAGAVLLFGVLRRMTGALWRSAMVAALFALHPLHVESVAWISERKDVLSGVFWMLTLLCYAHYVALPSLGRFLVLVLVFGLGLASKSMLVTLPFVLLLLDYWPLGRLSFPDWWGRGRGGAGFQPASCGVRVGGEAPSAPSPHPNPPPPGGREKRGKEVGIAWLLLEKLPLFALSAASSAITLVAQNLPRETPPEEPHRVGTALRGLLNYLTKTAYPSNLSVFYFYLPDEQQFWPAVAGAVILAAVTILVLVLWRRPYLLVGWFWFLVTLLPVSGLVHILGGHAMADRYTYIPLIGIFLAVCWGFADLFAWLAWPRVIPAVVGASTVTAAALTAWVEVGYWSDGVTLWQHAIDAGYDCDLVRGNLAAAYGLAGRLGDARENLFASLRFKPNRADAYNNLGLIAAEEGKLGPVTAQAVKLEEAIFYYDQALRLNPEYTQAHGNLAVALFQQGRFEEAIIHFTHVIEREPGNGEAHFKLGFSLLLTGEPAKASPHFEQALRLLPEQLAAELYIGLCLSLDGKVEQAKRHYEQLIASHPNVGRAYYFLGQALQDLGQADAAAASYRRAVDMDPQWPDEARQMAWGLATHPDPRRRYGALAIRLARQACEATTYQRPEMLDVLAAALAESGNYDEAQTMERRALELLSRTTSSDQVQALKERLTLYERRQPFRIGKQ